MLKRFEQFRQNRLAIPSLFDTSSEWRAMQSMYHIQGFPLNAPFTDIDALISQVKSTDVYRIEDEKAEFALAVHCIGYVDGVVSVWIWVANLSKH